MSRRIYVVLSLIIVCAGNLSAQSFDENKKRVQSECDGQLCAQEVSYWVGQSENPDPIMRHHEAFMEAFIKYVQNRPAEIVGAVSTETTSGIKEYSESINNETCHLETVSSVTYDGRETITISIGCGALVTYACLAESISSDDVLQTTTLLSIAYQDGSNPIAIESVHEYRKDCLTEKGTVTSQFSYKCTYISKYE